MRIPHLDLEGVRNHNVERLVDNAAHGLFHATRTLVTRSSSDSSSGSSSTCSSGDNSAQCVTPSSQDSSQNLAIILGVVIPLSCAALVLAYLHRRHLKKQKLEDINDPHKSLDFGMDGIPQASRKNAKGPNRKGPEMSVTDIGAASSHTKGLSMDMNLGNPYLLPGALNGSRESLHSMSRGLHDEHDPYRPVIMMRPSTDNDSVRFGRLNDDKGSMYSMSTGKHSANQDRAGLIANARPMSQSFGKRGDSMSPQQTTPPDDFAMRQLHSTNNHNIPPVSQRASIEKVLPEVSEKEVPARMPSPPEPATQKVPSFSRPTSTRAPPRSSSTSVTSAPRPPRKDSMSTIQTGQRPESSNYGDDDGPAPFRMTINGPDQYDVDPSMIYSRYSVDNSTPPIAERAEPMPALVAPQPVPAQNRLSVMGVRPLPPDMPTEENAEVRANRIRSFYKEYFDDSKPNPSAGQYGDDAYDGLGLDGVIYDPETGGFFAPNKPFAQGPGRRAMTPPPRARPRVSGNSQGGPHARKFSTMSAGRPRGRSVPKKQLPPPMPLKSLMTPHLLKDDSAIFNATDFAPPSTFRNEQNGSRPDSPMGTSRPYSPSVRAFTPLASSFASLSPLPSPHDLRKSGTFTALDFAPPSKIRDPGSMSPSDAGSIRSNRSGVSAVQNHAIQAGAYRVSRIPKEMVTSREDLGAQLRPKMDMISRA